MISWSTFQSLLIFFGPILVPRVLAFYRSLRAPSTLLPKPLPPSTSRALNILFVSALIFLASTLPYFNPPNIFTATQSRLQTPTSVLFTRLSALRALDPTDTALQSVFEASGLEARLLYLRFGPAVLATCPLTTPSDAAAATTYLLHALPSLLAPHLFHLAVLGLVTSAPVAGRAAARWRTAATMAGLALAGLELAAVATYEHTANARATRLADVEPFFWRAAVARGVAVAAVDALLGWVVWLGATERAFVVPAAAAERVEAQTRMLEGVLGKVRGLGAVRNVVCRDAGMRRGVERYWVQEAEVMRHVFEDRDVVAALNEALGSVDMTRLSSEADGYVQGVLGGAQAEHG